MSKSLVVWSNGTYSCVKHLTDEHAQNLLDDLEATGITYPVLDTVAPDWVRYVVQDSLGYWWAFANKPIESMAGYWQSNGQEETLVRSGIGAHTNKLFNVE